MNTYEDYTGSLEKEEEYGIGFSAGSLLAVLILTK
tara:strand:+ start:194 stop:298 length:105 start_codon:yes stop_codon:yes gene_type:complete